MRGPDPLLERSLHTRQEFDSPLGCKVLVELLKRGPHARLNLGSASFHSTRQTSHYVLHEQEVARTNGLDQPTQP